MKKSDTPMQVKLPDGSTQSTGINTQGQQTSQSGAGVLPAEYTYDPNTGALTNLKLFQSGTLDSGTPESTTWAYDPATGLLTSKTFNDGTSDVYTYNSKSQLTQVTEPFVNILNSYDSAGRQVSSTATDNVSGISVSDTVGGYDDQGRPTSQTQVTTDAGGEVQSSNTNALTYTPQGDLQSETQAGDVSTVYTYYPTSGFGSGGAPDALESVKVERMGTPIIVLSDTEYTYDPATKRIATVTINGQTFSYGYKSDTNLISSVSSGDVSTAFGYQSNNDNLLSITASDSETNLFSAGYTYNADQQRQTESVTQENSDGSSSTQDQTYGYDAALELNSVTDTNTHASIFSATYDGAGNRNDSSFTTAYGSANAMNQYASLVYNARGDLTNDGTLAYTWDAKDELTSETPDNPTTGSTEEEFQYDASDRRTEEDVYDYNATAGKWDAEADKVLRFAYQGNNLVAELNGADQLITSLTYGEGTSLLAVTDFTGSTPKTYQVVEDGSGSVVELVDPTNGAVAASYTYATYGTPLSATGPAANMCPYRFAGLIFDGPGLNYYGDNRYYPPTLEKWISRDPIAEAGGINTDEYADDDPINYNDPTGLSVAPASVVAEQENNWINSPWVPQPAVWDAAKKSAALAFGLNPNDSQGLQAAFDQGGDFARRVTANAKQAEYNLEMSAQVAAAQKAQAAYEAAYGTISALPPATTWEKIKNGGNELNQAADNLVTDTLNFPIKAVNAVAQSVAGEGRPSSSSSNYLFWEIQQHQYPLQYAADPKAADHIAAIEHTMQLGMIFMAPTAGVEAAPPAAAIQDVAVESQLITAGDTAVDGLPVNLSGEESAQSIISRTAQQQADRGVNGLQDSMSPAQLRAYNASPANGSRFLGTAVHNETNIALRKLYPGRFEYQTVGPDFIDTTTGEAIELTTPGEVSAHMAKDPWYNAASYSTYILPKPGGG